MTGSTWWCVECGRPAVSNQYGCKCPNGPTASKLDPPLELDVEATGTATKMVIEPPVVLDYIDVTFVVESGGGE